MPDEEQDPAIGASPTDLPTDFLSDVAWSARDAARVYGATKVGAAALADDGSVFAGCNIEHRFRSHDIHAEPNALATLVAAGATGCRAVLIAAERDNFTPCGSCMDWIFEIGGPECLVGFQRERGGAVVWRAARELMPYYPY